MDEQNQNEMNNDGVPHEGAPVGGDGSTHVHMENNGEGKSSMLATVAIVILVALLGYGVYAYLNREAGVTVEEETLLDGEIELEADIPATGDGVPTE
jgi:outer membrane lipoprotein SlyB